MHIALLLAYKSLAICTYQSHTLQPGQPDFTIAAATIAPIALQLAKAHSVIRDVQATRGKAESFQALVAIALANQSQQIHGLAQFQAASFRSGTSATAGDLSQHAPHAKPAQPILSPERRQLARQAKQHKVAHKQTLQVQERLDSLPAASRPIGSESHNASAVLTGHIHDGVQTVYPGKRGELQWDRWEGRSVLFFLLSMHSHYGACQSPSPLILLYPAPCAPPIPPSPLPPPQSHLGHPFWTPSNSSIIFFLPEIQPPCEHSTCSVQHLLSAIQ